MSTQELDFSDIAPYDDSVFKEKMETLVKDPGFLHAVNYTMPKEDVPLLIEDLLKIDNKYDFQHQVMFPFLEMLAKTTTAGISLGGVKYYNPALNYVFITNHRDIVLDASFLNLAFMRRGIPTSEVAIGNNLLVFDWINDLVRLNKSFIVKRNTGLREGLLAAKKLSAYIHKAILDKHESVWIAQREGRAKDSSDHTQEALVKMLALGGEGSFTERLKEINLMPVSISYEYDPNDYLKAKEFLLKRRNPNFKKSQRDDLFSMETGLLQFKGKVHFQLTPRINTKLDQIGDLPDNNTAAKYVGCLIDQAIHRSYEIFPINYIAFDILHETSRFKEKYTEEQRVETENYFNSQLDKIDIDDVTAEERAYMMEMMLVMYANPLKNKLKTILGGMV
ncbi:MAG: acyltransferase [Bacteroidales bacterium]|nr:acyltransferase [Bacteroidales bacterium]MBD5206439.1 acyltransferase [Bacteroidales bacterium]MBD5224256.1 acyltransferase [Bacteroidales bacterium]MBD5301671.1 acyltransferase [Bacteroides sp.]